MYHCQQLTDSRIVHDTFWVVDGTVKIRPLVPPEHVVLNSVQVPVVGGTTERLDNLRVVII